MNYVFKTGLKMKKKPKSSISVTPAGTKMHGLKKGDD